jgi:DnaJ family protein C protein 28
MPNIEEQIRKAQKEGQFDDLPGKGKPLELEDNPLADPEWQLAFRMLKEAGYSLPWIETLKEIEADIETARAGLRQAWEWRRGAEAEGVAREFVALEWERAFQNFQNRVAAINKRIRDVNLEVPKARFQRPMLEVAREVRGVEEEQG